MQLPPFIQKHKGGIVLLILLFPLCFSGIRNNHDWGDDFAQYIHQAKKITEGKSALSTGYIFNPKYSMLGPKAYPAGFPLLLVPVYAIFGNDITVFNIYISLWLIVAGFIWYLVLRRHHSELVAVLLSLIWCWHPWTLYFKTEIVADIPFTALLGALVLMYQRGFMQYDKENRKASLVQAISMGVVAGFLLAIKMQGLAIIAAVFAFTVLNNILNLKEPFEPKNKLYTNPVTVLIVGFLTCFTLINYLISGIRLSDLLSYSNNFSGEPILVSIRENLNYYTYLVQDFFQRSKPNWQVFPLLTQALVLAICFIGLIKQVVHKRPLLLWVFVAYIGLLLVYPYRGSGFRFLLPVAPIILHFAVEGFKSINWGFNLPKKAWATGLTLILLLQFLPEQVSAIKTAKNNFAGPQEKESVEAFAFINQNIPKDAVILFKKPRALALYTQRKSFAINPADRSFKEDIESYKTDFILLHKELSFDTERQYTENHPEMWNEIWRNTKFTLYSKSTR